MFLCLQCGAKDSEAPFFYGHMTCLECEVKEQDRTGYKREPTQGPHDPSTMSLEIYRGNREYYLDWLESDRYRAQNPSKTDGGVVFGTVHMTSAESVKYRQRYLFNLRQMHYHRYLGN